MPTNPIEAFENCYSYDTKGHYQLIGAFTKETITIHNAAIRAVFDQTAPKTMGLDAIIACDSALLALLIEYKRDFPSIQYTNYPERVTKLLDVYGAHELIA